MKRFTLLFERPKPVAREKQESALELAAKAKESAELRVLEEQYVDFCKSRATPSKQAAQDFYTLIRSPGVQMIGFAANGHELLIATHRVYLRGVQPVVWRDIGEFIIHVRRKPRLLITFENVAPLVTKIQNGNVTMFINIHHPHIPHDGHICMPNGMIELQTSVTEGDMPTAMEIMWLALNSVSPVHRLGLAQWPIAPEK